MLGRWRSGSRPWRGHRQAAVRPRIAERPARPRTSEALWRLDPSCAYWGAKHGGILRRPRPNHPGVCCRRGAKRVRRGRANWCQGPGALDQGPGGLGGPGSCADPLEEKGEANRMDTRACHERGWAGRGAAAASCPPGAPRRGTCAAACVTLAPSDGRASYDGRASRRKNFSQRTGRPGGRRPARRRARTGPVRPPRRPGCGDVPHGGASGCSTRLRRRTGSHEPADRTGGQRGRQRARQGANEAHTSTVAGLELLVLLAFGRGEQAPPGG